MNDQSVKADAGKIQPTLVPRELIEDVAEVREYGVKKYGKRDNWKDVEIQRYRDAAYRHWLAYVEDPDSVDEESGIPHYKHWACNCAFICYMERRRREAEQDRTFSEDKHMLNHVEALLDYICEDCAIRPEAIANNWTGELVAESDIASFLKGLCDMKGYFERKCKS